MTVKIEELLEAITNPKVLFSYNINIEGYFKNKRDFSFSDFVRMSGADLPNLEKISSHLESIKRKNQREGRVDNRRVTELLSPLRKRIVNLIKKTELFKDISGKSLGTLSGILNYDNLFSFSEDIAILLVFNGVSKNQVYDLLSIFKNPNIESAIQKDTVLIKPLFVINLASVKSLDKETLDFFYGIANKIKTTEDFMLLKRFIEAVYVYHSSYYGGKE